MRRAFDLKCWRKPITDDQENLLAKDKAQQTKVIAWLKCEDSYSRGKVTHIETHISHIFLVGDEAWKLKKALGTPFLDYTSPAKRRIAAEQEVQINRRTAPDLYLGIQPIVPKGDSFAFGREDESDRAKAVDWLVHMRRFDQALLFDRMLVDGRLTTTHVESLADALSALHISARVTKDEGGAAGMARHYKAPVNTLLADPSVPFSATDINAMADQLEQGWLQLSPILEARRRHGYVRHGHGDLHLANVCIYDNRATLFDAIEFSMGLACTDCLYDMAFPVMDFLFYDRPDYAAVFVSRYLEKTRDYKGLRLMPFYVAIRALVRAMANGLQPKRHEVAQRYFALAQASLTASPQPYCHAIGGLSGTGKSTLARTIQSDLGPLFGAVHIRSDGVRKRLHNVKPEQTLDDKAYGRKANWRTYQRLLKDTRHALLAGWPVVVDATFMNYQTRASFRQMANSLNIPFKGLWLHAPPDTLRHRISTRKKGASDADLSVLEKQLAGFTQPADWPGVDVSGTFDHALKGVRAAINLAKS